MKITFPVLVLLLVRVSPGTAAPNPPSGLMCELLAEPQLTVINSDRPALGWVVDDPRRGAVQSAYQILVSSRAEILATDHADVWDSGRVASDRSVDVRWSGPPLGPGRAYFWKVRTWDAAGTVSPYSLPQEFRRAATGPTAAFADRYPLEKTEIAPQRMVRKGPGDYFIDFGRAAFGTVKLTLTAPAPGLIVQVCLGEVLAGPETINPDPGGARRYRVMLLPLRAGTHTYGVAITPGERNSTGAAIRMPPEVGEVMPFRYCELVGAPGPIAPDEVRQVAVHYHFDDAAAAFSSSDSMLNRIWEFCRYSIKATSFTGTYVDGDRERIPYEADAYITELGHYASDREFTLARHTLDYLLDHATWPAEWQMHMPLAAWEDYLHSGNSDLLVRRYDELAAKTLFALERRDGLVASPEAHATPEFLRILHFDPRPPPPLKHPIPQEVLDSHHPDSVPLQALTDWPPAESDGYEMRPVGVVTNAFHYGALRAMAQIAGALGRWDEERAWAARAARTYRAFNTVFFDPAQGTHIDGEGSRHHSLHAAMLPLAFGLVDPERIPTVTAFLRTRGMACSVYGAQYLFEALYHANQGAYALALMTAPGDRSWRHMIADVGTTITLEAWDDRFKPNEDWNHAWGAAPANLIPRLLMGIEPIAPGFARFRVRPQTAGLARAALTLPTLRGPVRLEVTQPDDRTWRAALTVPANTRAEVEVPTTRPDQVEEGGRPAGQSPGVRYLGLAVGRCVYEVPGGTYEFTVRQ